MNFLSKKRNLVGPFAKIEELSHLEIPNVFDQKKKVSQNNEDLFLKDQKIEPRYGEPSFLEIKT